MMCTQIVCLEGSFSVSAKPVVVPVFTTKETDMPELLQVLLY